MITEIDFNGKKIGLKYGLPAIRSIYEKLDKVSFLAAETYSIVSLVQIVYSGYVNYCLVKELTPEITFEDVFDWVEDNVAGSEVEKAVNAFNESKYIKKAVEVKEEEKKTLTGKKSKK